MAQGGRGQSLEDDNILRTLSMMDQFQQHDEAGRRATEQLNMQRNELALQQSQAKVLQWQKDQEMQRSAELNNFATTWDPLAPGAKAALNNWRSYTTGILKPEAFAGVMGPNLTLMDHMDAEVAANADLGHGLLRDKNGRIDLDATHNSWEALRGQRQADRATWSAPDKKLYGDLSNQPGYSEVLATDAVKGTVDTRALFGMARDAGIFSEEAAANKVKNASAAGGPRLPETAWEVEQGYHRATAWGPKDATGEGQALGVAPGVVSSPASLTFGAAPEGLPLLRDYRRADELLGPRVREANNAKVILGVNKATVAISYKEAVDERKAAMEHMTSIQAILTKGDVSEAGRVSLMGAYKSALDRYSSFQAVVDRGAEATAAEPEQAVKYPTVGVVGSNARAANLEQASATAHAGSVPEGTILEGERGGKKVSLIKRAGKLIPYP